MADLTSRLEFNVEKDPDVRQSFFWDGELKSINNTKRWQSQSR